MEDLNLFASNFASFAWGPWLVALLLGSGAYFLLRSQLTPFKYLPHAFDVLEANTGLIRMKATLAALKL